jgi:hypothetical protein
MRAHSLLRSPRQDPTMSVGKLERHLAQTVEQGLRILLVTSLTRVIGAERQAAHAGQLMK